MSSTEDGNEVIVYCPTWPPPSQQSRLMLSGRDAERICGQMSGGHAARRGCECTRGCAQRKAGCWAIYSALQKVTLQSRDGDADGTENAPTLLQRIVYCTRTEGMCPVVTDQQKFGSAHVLQQLGRRWAVRTTANKTRRQCHLHAEVSPMISPEDLRESQRNKSTSFKRVSTTFLDRIGQDNCSAD